MTGSKTAKAVLKSCLWPSPFPCKPDQRQCLCVSSLNQAWSSMEEYGDTGTMKQMRMSPAQDRSSEVVSQKRKWPNKLRASELHGRQLDDHSPRKQIKTNPSSVDFVTSPMTHPLMSSRQGRSDSTSLISVSLAAKYKSQCNLLQKLVT